MATFGKELLTRLTIICSLCILTKCNLCEVIFRLDFEGGILVLIAPVSGHCILVTFFWCQLMKQKFLNATTLSKINKCYETSLELYKYQWTFYRK